MEPVRFLFDGQLVEASHGETVLEALLRLRRPVDHSCGGFGSCGTCRLIVESPVSDLPPRNEVELEIATDRGFQAQERLACQIEVFTGLKVRRPRSGRSEDESEDR